MKSSIHAAKNPKVRCNFYLNYSGDEKYRKLLLLSKASGRPLQCEYNLDNQQNLSVTYPIPEPTSVSESPGKIFFI